MSLPLLLYRCNKVSCETHHAFCEWCTLIELTVFELHKLGLLHREINCRTHKKNSPGQKLLVLRGQ